MMAAFKIICDHIESLAPIGEFLGKWTLRAEECAAIGELPLPVDWAGCGSTAASAAERPGSSGGWCWG